MLSATMIEPGYALPMNIYQPRVLSGYFGDDTAVIPSPPAKKSIAPGLLSIGASALLLGGLFLAIRKA